MGLFETRGQRTGDGNSANMLIAPPAQPYHGPVSLVHLVHHLNWHGGDAVDITPRFQDGEWDYLLHTKKNGGPIETGAYRRETGEALISQICAEAGIVDVGIGEFRCSRQAISKSPLVAKIAPPINGIATWRVSVTREGADSPRKLELAVLGDDCQNAQ